MHIHIHIHMHMHIHTVFRSFSPLCGLINFSLQGAYYKGLNRAKELIEWDVYWISNE